jgi:hypothetical protein
MPTTIVEPGGKVQLPSEWAADWEGKAVEVERTPEGILLRPRRKLTWDEVFAGKPLQPGVTEPRDLPEEVSGDDLWL